MTLLRTSNVEARTATLHAAQGLSVAAGPPCERAASGVAVDCRQRLPATAARARTAAARVVFSETKGVTRVARHAAPRSALTRAQASAHSVSACRFAGASNR